MLFNSIEFLIFFPLVTALYFLLPHKIRWFLLLISSCVFYMAFVPKYILILGVTIVVDYFAGIIIARMQGDNKRIFLIVSLITNIGMLFVFKYFNFFNENIKHLADFLNWNYPISGLSIILPIGLSFHTFQSMSYIIEVYRGKQQPEKHFGIYALYVMYYPQLVAGPIERPQNMLWQFHTEHSFDAHRVSDGMKLMAWGLFKKVVIADNLALVVNSIYGNPTQVNGLSLVVATYFFAFQIYCDFSGYTDIARGASRVMGIELMQNFKRPYFSKTISELWKRWHISLSSWFSDYVYIPLGAFL
ncbi:MBOAT family O-acyltransferase [Ruminiclostridium cellulolyticum]|uniref:MBOAT family O-acyltransferase n=1 Tax=Ruminiclostridium cellulolyticum TaxID=1521 RepID=UPI0000E8DDC6|nr:MBOAT family O-acyltransferase [Ruminiclostridium cellulolyticum]